jgi:hypothetical protein
VTTGICEFRIARIMSRMESARPPGVSSCRIRTSALSSWARSRVRSKNSRVAGPIASSISMKTAVGLPLARGPAGSAPSDAAAAIAWPRNAAIKTRTARERRMGIMPGFLRNEWLS